MTDYPGTGEYNIGKNASQNSNPTWKFGTSIRKDFKHMKGPSPGSHDIPSYITDGRIHKMKRRMNETEI